MQMPYWFKDLSYRYFFIINIVTFKSVWAVGVLGQGSITALALLPLGLHFALSPSRKMDLQVMAMIASLGIAIDLLLTLLGVFVFAGVFFPLWLVSIWLAFALVFNHSCVWLHKLPWYAQALLGAMGGTASYYFGYTLGAVDFGYANETSLAIVAGVWGMAFPLFCLIAKTVASHSGSQESL